MSHRVSPNEQILMNHAASAYASGNGQAFHVAMVAWTAHHNKYDLSWAVEKMNDASADWEAEGEGRWSTRFMTEIEYWAEAGIYTAWDFYDILG